MKGRTHNLKLPLYVPVTTYIFSANCHYEQTEVSPNFYRLIFGKFNFDHVIGEKKFRYQTSEMRETSLISCTIARNILGL
jgi:hypothetical protein